MLHLASRRIPKHVFTKLCVDAGTFIQGKSIGGGWSTPTCFLRERHHQRRRRLHSSAIGSATTPHSGETGSVRITFVEGETEIAVHAPLGHSVLDAALSNGVKLEGRCEGSLRCSTCHVIVTSRDAYDALDEPSEDELDILDCTFRATKTSRLACQLLVGTHFDGLKLTVPGAETRPAVE